jgi:ATP synthase protein I
MGKDEGPREGPRLKGLAMYSTVGIAMVLATFLGLAIGLYLDELFGTEPWLMIFFLFMGIAAGFLNIYTIIKRYGE